jgi:hypothetical protein
MKGGTLARKILTSEWGFPFLYVGLIIEFEQSGSGICVCTGFMNNFHSGKMLQEAA